MSVELKIQDVSPESLNFEQAIKNRLSPLGEFWQFGRYPRTFSDASVFKDSFFCDLYITSYVENSVLNSPPPHPGIFEEFFPTILSRLVREENTLTLYVKSLDPDYFDELDVIKTQLAPRNLSYILLPNPLLPGDRRTQLDVGHLIFEWPLDSLDYVTEHWFMTPIVTVEGYISRQPVLGSIAKLYFEPDTEERIRNLLRTIEVGFRVWPDNNGLFLLSDKFDCDALKERLHVSELAPLLEEASRRY